MIKRYFCTHFDINYLPHAKSLAESLITVSPASELFAFCMDDDSYEKLLNDRPKNVKLIHYSKLETQFPDLLKAKNNRSRIEYFYTCSPSICYYILTEMAFIDEVTYLDADLYFFNSPEPIFDELKDSSVGIIEHKFSFFSKRNRKYGNFNVGWITFKKNSNGMACLNSWKEKCIDWCYQRLENDKYADQKYLDFWQRDFDGVYIIKNIGANLAIWNISNYKISFKNDIVCVDNKPLIFYHFANLKQINFNTFQTDLSRVFVSCKGVIRDHIYLPYVISITKHMNHDKLIIAKEERKVSFYNLLLRQMTRVIRQKLFPDLIQTNYVKK
jgi:hypothetical protein